MSAHHPAIELDIIRLLRAYLEPLWAAEPERRIDVDPATRFAADLQMDSFQVMEFLVEIEDEFDISIDLNSLSDVHTVAELAAVVSRQAGA